MIPNWYFADPVNQKGLTKYVDERHIYELYSFDQIQIYNGVSCELVSNGLKFSFPGYADAGYYIFGVPIEGKASLRGKIVTLSVLVPDVSLEINNSIYLYCKFRLDYHDSVEELFITTPGLHTTTFKIPEDAEMILIGCGVRTKQPVDITIMAAKLELGPRQTLAHQDADGNWVLNDPPPNKALELLKCQRYFNVVRTSGGSQALSTTVSDSNGLASFPFAFPTVMRCVPNVSFTGTLRVHGHGQEFQNVESIAYATIQGNIVNVFVGGLQPLTTYTLDGHPSVELYFDSNP